MGKVTLLLVLLLASPVYAEDQPSALAPEHRTLADAISTGFVVAQLTADTIVNFRSPQRTRALLEEACSVGLAVGIAEVTKHFVHRLRPDGSDWKSFFSEHTAVTDAARGWSLHVGYVLTVGAAYGRAAANKHHWSDIAFGFGVGELTQRVCGGINP